METMRVCRAVCRRGVGYEKDAEILEKRICWEEFEMNKGAIRLTQVVSVDGAMQELASMT